MARPSAPSYQRQSQPTDVKRAPAALPPPRLGLRKTGGIRVLDKSTTSSSRQVSDSKTSQSDPSALYKRVFYPNASDAPARILATPGTEQLDIQLYNLLALICRGFISPWYSKVSRDRAFLLEIVRVASYVFRRIEDKLVGTDSEEPIDAVKLLCVSIPGVLQRHVRDFRQAKEMEGSAYAAGVGVPYTAAGAAITPFEAIFHSLQPHAAIASSSVFSTSGSTVAEKLPTHINADYVRALVDSMLREVLPKEDYTAETEKAVVREVMVGIILAGVFNKVSQPWFIHGLIVKFLERKDRPTSDGQENVMVSVPRPSVIKRVSDFCAAVPVLFYRVTALFTYLSLLVVTALATPYISKTRARDLARRPISLTFTFVDSGKEGRQILSQARWLLATSSTIFGSLLDKIIVHFFYTQIFNTSSLSSFLKIVEAALFPNGYPAPSVPDPTEDEQVLLKERAYRAIRDAVPKSVLPYLLPGLPPDEAASALAMDILDPFQDQFCNNQLYLYTLDLVVANLCPDLVVKQ